MSDRDDLGLRESELRLKEHLHAWTAELVSERMKQELEERRHQARRQDDRIARLDDRHKELDRIVRGERGDNGLASTIKMLERAEAQRSDREKARSRKETAILLMVLGLVVTEAFSRFLGS